MALEAERTATAEAMVAQRDIALAERDASLAGKAVEIIGLNDNVKHKSARIAELEALLAAEHAEKEVSAGTKLITPNKCRVVAPQLAARLHCPSQI